MDIHDYTNLEAYPWVEHAMRNGHWELMPLLSVSAKAFREGFRDSHYTMASRKGLKVKGAISMFRMKAEHARFRKALIRHLWQIRGDYHRHDSFPLLNELRKLLRVYQHHSHDFLDWTGDLSFTLKLEFGHWSTTMYHVIQTGVLLVSFGMRDSVMFQVLESRMDVALAWMHDNLIGRRMNAYEKFTFRNIIDEIMLHEERYKFLFYFSYKMDNIQIPFVQRFLYLWNMVSRIVNFRVIRTMPSFVRGSVATLSLMDKLADKPLVNLNGTRLKLNAFKDYVHA